MREVVARVAAQQDRDVILLEHSLMRIARETHGRQQRLLVRPPVVRTMHAPRLRDLPLEVRQPPPECDSEPRRRLLVGALELVHYLGELTLCAANVAGADVRRQQLVMARRDDDLDVVVEDHRDRVEQVLLVGPGK